MSMVTTVVNRPTTFLIIFILLLGLGVFALVNLPVDLMPEINFPMLIVMTTYQGAGPEEVERTISRPMEAVLSGVPGLEELTTISSKGSSIVLLEFTYGTDLADASNSVRDMLERIRRVMPEAADTPMIIKMDFSMMPIMGVIVTSDKRTQEELRELAEDTIVPRMEQTPGIATATVMGGREKIIRVEIQQNRLEAYDLTVSQIRQMLAVQNMQTAAGTIKEGGMSYILTTMGEYTSIEEIKDTVISYRGGGFDGTNVQRPRSIFLRDIADVFEGYKDQSTEVLVDNQSAVMMMVQKQSGKNSVQVADALRIRIERMKKELPPDIHVDELFNTTDMIENSMNQVTSAALYGALLAIIVLFVFLRSWKPTLIIGISIPVSIIVTMLTMYFAGLTLNLMTMAGLVLGIGMLVDNSIVILENIYHYREKGAKLKTSAVLGSSEMVVAIVASTITTICVFAPLVMFQGLLEMAGEMFAGLAFTVVISLGISLFTAIFLVPILSSHYLPLTTRKQKKLTGKLAEIDSKFDNFFHWLEAKYKGAVKRIITGGINNNKILRIFMIIISVAFLILSIYMLVSGIIGLINNYSIISTIITIFLPLILFGIAAFVYKKSKQKILSNKLVLVSALLLIFIFSMVLIPIIGWEMMPAQEEDNVQITAKLPMGTPLEQTIDVLRQLQIIVEREVDGSYERLMLNAGGGMMGSNESHSGSIRINLPEYKKRTMTATEIKNKMRPFLNQFPGVEFSMEGRGGMGGVNAVDIVLRTDDLVKGKAMGEHIVEVLKTNLSDMITEPTIDLTDGLPQYEIIIDREKMYDLGLNAMTVGGEIAAAVDGIVATRFKFAGKDYDVLLILAEADRSALPDLDKIFITSPMAGRVALSNFVSYEQGTGPLTIRRENQSRVIHVTAASLPGTPSNVLAQRVEDLIRREIPIEDDVILEFGGDNAEMARVMMRFIFICVVAAFLVFGVMASLFESFRDPFIIIFTFPLSLIGIVMIYLITGTIFNIMTAVGLLVLLGVIVNNGIVLIDYTNLLRKRGYSLNEACIAAAGNRLRPILMSTLTTILGLVPMAFFPGEGSEMVAPIGKTVLGGLSFGTLMTLFLMPTIYSVFNRRSDELAAIKKAKRESIAKGESRAERKEHLAHVVEAVHKEDDSINDDTHDDNKELKA